MSDSLISVAQRMGVWNKMRERLNKMTSGLKRLPTEYVRQVDEMRAIDEQIRDIVKRYLPSYIKSAEKSFKNRQLLDVGYFAGKFNATLKHISSLLKPLDEMSMDYIDEFYSDYAHANPSEDPLSMQHEASDKIDAMIKEADLLDLFRSDRTRAARMVEKLFAAQVKDRNRAMERLIGKMHSIYDALVANLTELAPIRAQGDLMNYIKGARKIAGRAVEFEKSFTAIYNKHLAPLHQKVKDQAEKQKNMFYGKPEGEIETRMHGVTDKSILQPATTEVPTVTKEVLENVQPNAAPTTEPTAEAQSGAIPDAPKNEKQEIEVGLSGDSPGTKPTPASTIDIGLRDEPEPKTPAPTGLGLPHRSVKPFGGGLGREPAIRKTRTKNKGEAKGKIEFFNDLIKVAETGDTGLMIAMCADYSQQLEDAGDIEGSMKLLAIAEAL